MKQFEYPEVMARFYDVIYHHQRDGIDNDFFLDAIARTRGKILEIGVGTGRLFTEALQRGADIYGIDISPSMIKVLLRKLHKEERFRITRQDIVDFSLDETFTLAIAPFHMMSHVIDTEDQLKALNRVCHHLVPGGTFIFDVFVPDLRQLVKGFKNYIDFSGEYAPGKKIRRIVSTRPDLINQLIHITFRFEWDEEGTRNSREWKLPFRFFFRYELEHLVARSDFTTCTILGDYRGNPLTSKSQAFIVVCQK